jgi:hypothetical protein
VIDLDSQDPEYLRAMAFWLERWAEGSAKDLWKLADALPGTPPLGRQQEDLNGQ